MQMLVLISRHGCFKTQFGVNVNESLKRCLLVSPHLKVMSESVYLMMISHVKKYLKPNILRPYSGKTSEISQIP